MPSYQYQCMACAHEQEEFHRMSEVPSIRCNACGDLCHKMPVLGQFIYPADATWHGENNGKGKYISGLGRKNDPDSYATSLTAAKEKAKRKGLSYELA
jgi:putative FmdB family regulatory protein